MSKVKDSGRLQVTEADIAAAIKVLENIKANPEQYKNAAIKKLEDIKAHPKRYKEYDSFDELLEDLFAEGTDDDPD